MTKLLKKKQWICKHLINDNFRILNPLNQERKQIHKNPLPLKPNYYFLFIKYIF